MRETRNFLLTITVATVASTVLILSLLGLGADFGANVWPNAATADDRTQLRMPDPPRPPALGPVADTVSGGARAVFPAVARPPASRRPFVAPAPADAGRVLRLRRLAKPRRPARDLQRTAPVTPPPGPATAAPVAATVAAAQQPAPALSAGSQHGGGNEDVENAKHGGRPDRRKEAFVATVAAPGPAPPPSPVVSGPAEDAAVDKSRGHEKNEKKEKRDDD